MVALTRPSWRAVDLPLLGFVLGLGLIVRALADRGLGLVDDILPNGAGLLGRSAPRCSPRCLPISLNNVPACCLCAAAAAAGPGSCSRC